MVQMTCNIVCPSTENIVRKEEIAGYQHFLLFSQCFQMLSSPGSFNLGIIRQKDGVMIKATLTESEPEKIINLQLPIDLL